MELECPEEAMIPGLSLHLLLSLLFSIFTGLSM
jgi:hypothetical protein